MQKKVIGITGIDTEVGKTIVSAIVVKALQADYWKPVQAGELDSLDSSLIKQYNTDAVIHPERYLLTEPMSPHAAAEIDNIELSITDFKLPDTQNFLVVEGAGGVMVPLNYHGLLIADLFKTLTDEVILVSKHYLGSINHTLLSVEYLQMKGIKLRGIIFVGDENRTTESIIETVSGIPILGRIPWTDDIDQTFIENEAKKLRQVLS